MDEKLIIENKMIDFLDGGTTDKKELFKDKDNPREKVVLFYVFNPESGLYEKKYLTKIKKKNK